MLTGKDRHMGAMTISIADTIRTTSLSESTIYRLIREGQLDSIKIGKRRLVKIASLQRLIGDDAGSEAR
jgi:excisionase family DNA binding protein